MSNNNQRAPRLETPRLPSPKGEEKAKQLDQIWVEYRRVASMATRALRHLEKIRAEKIKERAWDQVAKLETAKVDQLVDLAQEVDLLLENRHLTMGERLRLAQEAANAAAIIGKQVLR